MRRPLDVLNAIRIASPCPASWDNMAGDDRSRHCNHCDRTVYDLSGYTAEAAVALLTAQSDTVCLRLHRRADGRVLTADCPVGRAARLRQNIRRGLVAACAWLGFAWLTGCNKNIFDHVTQGEPPRFKGPTTTRAMGTIHIPDRAPAKPQQAAKPTLLEE